MKSSVLNKLRRRQRRILRRIENRPGPERERPMIAAHNIHYELGDRVQGLGPGGIGAMLLLARRTGLIADIDHYLHLFKCHRPYHESDHGLNIALKAQPPRTSQTRKHRPKGRGHEEVAPSQKINRQEILAGFSIPDGSSPTRDSPTEVAPKPSKKHEVIRAIQDLIWKEALLSLPWSEKFEDIGEFQHYIREHLPQNSLSTRDRYAQTVVRWFYPDGLKGLTAKVWRHYQDPGLAEEILRYRYLCAETMAGALVADALFPIGENAAIPDSYIVQFIRERFGSAVPDKTTERLKANLRKLGFLSSGKERRDLLRPIAPSATAFLILLHFLFSQGQPGGVEFRVIASESFWKYLGFKSEDRLRAILREALDRGLIAKYVVADRIESISLRYSFSEFVEGRMRL